MKNLKPNKNKLSKKAPYLKTVPLHLWLTLIWIVFSIINTEAQTVSQFSTGTTFTQHTFKTNPNDNSTVDRGKALILNSTKIINQHLMGFGALDPEPTPGNYNFSSIENRIGNNNGLGNEAEIVVLTACCSPDWMKGIISETTDWSKIEVAPLPQHFDDYAKLVAEVVKRPEFSNIKYVQVWNEMKGFWHPTEDRWNYESYTNLYNKVWTAVKAVRPDIKIGGPYIVANSYGSEANARQKCDGILHGGDWGKFDCRDLDVVTYWLKNKIGADFITVDAHIKNKDGIQPVNQFERTKKFADFITWLRNLDNSVYPGATTLPVWWAEWYATPDNLNASQPEKNALMTTALIQMIKSGASTALLWGPQGNENGDMFPLALFNDTQIDEGGRATLFHTTQKYLYDYFSAGTTLIESYSNNANIEILASNSKTLLVNTSNNNQTFTFRGLTQTLQGYEVRLIDTPQIDDNSCNLLTNSNFNNGTSNWTSWNCDINEVSGMCEITNIQPVENTWNAALAQGDFTLENGQQYVLSFEAASIQNNREFTVKIGLNQAPDWTNYYSEKIPLSPDYQRYDIPFTMSHPTTSKARLEFHIGTDATNLVFDNIRLKLKEEDCSNSCNQVINGNFTDGLQSWNVQRCEATNTKNGIYVNLTQRVNNFWDVALKQGNFTFEQGKQYEVSFKAKAEGNRIIQIKAGKSGIPYTTYHIEKINLTSNEQYHRYTFTMEYATDNQALFEFFFGDSNINLQLGEISVVETGCSAGLRQSLIQESDIDIKVYPNPVNEQLNISFDKIDHPKQATIRIFNIDGRLFLEEQKEISTNKKLQLKTDFLPIGEYIVQIRLNGKPQLTRKIIKY